MTTKQASELLPLWEMMKVLANSDTSAQEEVDATISEIKETLTPAQLQAIADMKLTEQNISAFEQGSNTTVQSSSKSSSGSQSGGGFGGPGGGGPGGDSSAESLQEYPRLPVLSPRKRWAKRRIKLQRN